MPKLDITRARRIKTVSGEALALKGPGFAWERPGPLLYRYIPGDAIAGTSGTSGTYVDASGVLRPSTGVPRDLHHVAGVRTLLVEGARTNKALVPGEPSNAVGTSITTASPGGVIAGFNGVLNAGATLTVVDDAAALAAAGLDVLCPGGRAYRLTVLASGGTAYAYGPVGNLNAHVASVYVRGAAGSVNVRGTPPTDFEASAGYRRVTAGPRVAPNTSRMWEISAAPNSSVFFVLPQMEAAASSSSSIPGSASGTVARAADTVALAVAWEPQVTTRYVRRFDPDTLLRSDDVSAAERTAPDSALSAGAYEGIWYFAGERSLSECRALAGRAGSYAESVVMDGAWTWYNDSRVIVAADRSYVGTVTGAFLAEYASGSVLVGGYDRLAREPLTPFNLSSGFQTDDHDNPALLRLGDGHLLAAYSKHPGDSFSRRSTAPENHASWAAQVSTSATHSYADLLQLSQEGGPAAAPYGGRVYLFSRHLTSYRQFRYSDDGGQSWTPDVQVFGAPDGRPYPKYYSDGAGRIDVLLTDGHPVEVASVNSVYHAYYEGGNWYKTDGTLIRSMAAVVAGAPINPAEMTRVYDSAASGKRAWTWQIVRGAAGTLTAVFAVFESLTDHRYYAARWDGAAWAVSEVCTAGSHLYAAEPYYSGGICMDADSANTIYCVRESGGQWTLWRFVTPDHVEWSGEQIVLAERPHRRAGSALMMRPFKPVGENAIYICRGRYTTYTNFRMWIERVEV